MAGGTLLFCAPPPARAASPELVRIDPPGAQRGTQATLDLYGARLENPLDLLCYRPGVTLDKLESVDAGHVRATITIAADCPPGVMPVRLVTHSGVTQLRLLSIGADPEIAEVEPNNDRDKPQVVQWPVTINGRITNEDIDYFEVQVEAGQRLNFEIEAMRLGETLFDPHIELSDPRGAVLASADDTPLVRQDAIISHTFATAGVYRIAVREASYRGSDASRYRLHIGAFPRPQGVFPPGGAPGEQLTVRWLGDAELSEQQVTLPAAESPLHGLFAADERGVAPSPIPVRLTTVTRTLEVEPNDKREQATELPLPGAAAGVLGAPGDADWYHLAGKNGQKIVVRVLGRALRSPIDPLLSVYKSDGAHAASNDDSGGPDSMLRFTLASDDGFYLRVRDLLGRGGALYTYWLEVTEVVPQLRLSTPPEMQHVAVPAGNRNAIVVNANRADFGGPLLVDAADLPPGTTLHATTMPANVAAMPIVIEAAADAAPAARLVDLSARHTENENIRGRLRQALRLTEYKNNTMAYQVVERLPVAVTDAAPFSVRIVGPNVPLVRLGSLDVAVEVQRSEGFTSPIQLRVLWTPPGVGAGAATIPGDQAAATIHFDAGARAALGDWPLVVVAVANVNGPLQVASQLAMLTVAEPFKQLAVERARVTLGESAEVLVHLTAKESFPGEGRVVLR
ncbi:MAG: peptidase, partial [Planctomycetota bacterium]